MALCGRRETRLKETAEAIGGETLCIVTDVSDAAAAKKAVSELVASWGRLDVLINNAGVPGPCGYFHEAGQEALDQCIDINLKGAIYMMQAALQQAMLEQGSGCILNVNSVAGKASFPGWSIYCASKYGLRAVTEAVAAEMRELKKPQIKVLGFYPGAIETEIWEHVPDSVVPDVKPLPVEHAVDAIMHMLQQPVGAIVPELTLTPI